MKKDKSPAEVELEGHKKISDAFFLSCTAVDDEQRKKLLDPEIQAQKREEYVTALINEKLSDIEIPDVIDFIPEYQKKLLKEYNSNGRSNRLLQRASELVLILKMKSKGIKKPEAVLDALKNTTNFHSYYKSAKNSNEEDYLVKFETHKAGRTDFLNLLAKFDDPALVLSRMQRLGIDASPYLSNDTPEIVQLLSQLSEISEDHFINSIKNLSKAWWLTDISVMGNEDQYRSINTEFLARLRFVVNGDFNAEQLKTLKHVQDLALLAGYRPNLNTILSDTDGFESSALIAQEYRYVTRENMSQDRYYNGLRSIGREVQVTEMIQAGLHLSPRKSVLERSGAYDETEKQEAQKLIDFGYSKLYDPVFLSTRAYLELVTIEDSELVGEVVDLLEQTRNEISQLSDEVKSEIIQKIISSDIHDMDQEVQLNSFPQWQMIIETYSKQNQDYKASTQKIKNLLLNCFIFNENGMTDTPFLRELLTQPVSINSLITEKVLSGVDDSERPYFRLISLIDAKNNYHIQNFLIENEEKLGTLLDSAGNVTPDFCHAFARYDKPGEYGSPAHINSLAPLIAVGNENFTSKEGQFWQIITTVHNGYIYYDSYKKFMDLPELAINIIIQHIDPDGHKLLGLFTHYSEQVKSVLAEAESKASPPFELLEFIFDKCSEYNWGSNFPNLDFSVLFKDALGELEGDKKKKWQLILFVEKGYQLNLYSKFDELPIEVISDDGTVTESFFDFFITSNGDNYLHQPFQESLAKMLRRSNLDSFSPFQKSFWEIYLKSDQNPQFQTLLLKNKMEGKIVSEREIEVARILNNDEYFSNGLVNRIIFENFDYLLEVGAESTKKYIVIAQRIEISPSTEIARIKNELIPELLKSDNPEALFNKVEDIFIRNNLPLVGKLFKIFQVLNPVDKLSQTIDEKPAISPVIKAQSERRRYHTFFSDLVKANLRSSNRSLVRYLKSAKDASSLIQQHQEGVDLSTEQKGFLVHFLDRVVVLLENSEIEDITEDMPEYSVDEYDVFINESVKRLGINSGTELSDKLARMFLYPAGIHSVDEAINYANAYRERATERNIEFAHSITTEGFRIQEGDLFKGLIKTSEFETGIGYDYLRNILQNGSVAKDFLGSSAGSDSTPFDTDVTCFTQADLQVPLSDLLRGEGDGIEKRVEEDGSVTNIGARNISMGYGSLYLLTRNREQFFRSDLGEKNKGREKYELFYTGVVTGGSEQKRHFGVRTGIPSSEFDCFLVNDELLQKLDVMHNIKFAIAEQGQYIPIVDFDGNLLFTPEEYQKLRNAYDGIEEYFGSEMKISKGYSSPELIQFLISLSEEVREGREVISECTTEIREKISQVLMNHDVKLLADYESSLLGAELQDIGSTGRGTNAPNDHDFDFALLLDSKDIGKANQIHDDLMAIFDYDDTIPSSNSNEHLQIRLKGVSISGRKVDVDIGINTKKEVDVFASHDSVKAKLDSIKATQGQEVHDEVVATIVLAKQLLKKGNAYKIGKEQHGGWGGMGTEYWILHHGGNLDQAMQSVWDVSQNVNSLDEFKAKYPLYDVGMNFKLKKRNRNFTEYMTEDGYSALLAVVKDYLGK